MLVAVECQRSWSFSILICLVLRWWRTWPCIRILWATSIIPDSSNKFIMSTVNCSSPHSSTPSSDKMNENDTTSFLVKSSSFERACSRAFCYFALLLDIVLTTDLFLVFSAKVFIFRTLILSFCPLSLSKMRVLDLNANFDHLRFNVMENPKQIVW